jgi:hypothetical protein
VALESVGAEAASHTDAAAADIAQQAAATVQYAEEHEAAADEFAVGSAPGSLPIRTPGSPSVQCGFAPPAQGWFAPLRAVLVCSFPSSCRADDGIEAS